jgi:hypothetical protein
MDQDAYEDAADYFSFVVTVRRRDGKMLKTDLGRIRGAIIQTAEDLGIDVKVSGRRQMRRED